MSIQNHREDSWVPLGKAWRRDNNPKAEGLQWPIAEGQEVLKTENTGRLLEIMASRAPCT
jgi:hypothetical protein